MLVVMRRVGESIVIGDSIVVKVIGIQGNQVMIGTQAPKEISVDRTEVYLRKHPEQTMLKMIDPVSQEDQYIF